jgi:guanylate kinase
VELTEGNRALQQAQNDEVQKFEKKYEVLKMKMEMETKVKKFILKKNLIFKMKEDLAELKRRLEKELEESEKILEDETGRRKSLGKILLKFL